MRAGLSTIQQTLTPEAASVLSHSIAEAGRRNHGQTTPLHVAATLLASPSGFLRQACIRSHPNSSHPLQCRALELCFSVALERLPAAQGSNGEPPVSNALMAALKRAQAHQRRGCPEQQQQPLLAVKVELEQLVISILDDPSVSRVMREASFSSPAVKASIEQALNSNSRNLNSTAAGNIAPASLGMGFRPSPIPLPIPNRNMYMNPLLQQGNSNSGPSPNPVSNRNLYMNPLLQKENSNSGQLGQQRNEEIKRVIDILLRSKKRNPVLVGESEPEAVIKELYRRIEERELSEESLKNAEVISIEKEFRIGFDKSQIESKFNDLKGLVEARIGDSIGGGVILDLGDLKWLVEGGIGIPGSGGNAISQQVVSEAGHLVVAEMGKLVASFGEDSNRRIWLIGTATCETYLRCQVYHPSMESLWDLQAVPVTSRSSHPGMFPKMGTNGFLSNSIQSLNPLKSFSTLSTTLQKRTSENFDRTQKTTFCPQCSENYEKELEILTAIESDKSSFEGKQETARPSLPQWLQNAKVQNSEPQTGNQELLKKQGIQLLQKKWSDTCLNLHPNYHQNFISERTDITTPITSLLNPNSLKLHQNRNLHRTLQMNPSQVAIQPLDRASSPPRSPVRTDLVLGPTKVIENGPEKTDGNDHVKDILGCISSEPRTKKFDQLLNDKFADVLDADSFKKLLKGLMERAWWQPEAASAVATTVTQCKLGNGRRRGSGGAKGGSTWLLFTGPDRVGKKKMASVLSDHVCGSHPVVISLGSRRANDEQDLSFRGKTVLDRIAGAVRQNPFSVIMLEDIDEADMLVRGNIKRAMDRGRLVDSHGREINLGNVIFILTGDWSAGNQKNSSRQHFFDEKRLVDLVSDSCQFRLIVGEKRAKRRANWLNDQERPTRARRETGSGLCLDLNLTADIEDERTDGSHNSSDLTVDHEDEAMITSVVPHELADSIDAAIVFKPVDSVLVRLEIKKTILAVDEKIPTEVEEEVLEKIHAGVWAGPTSLQEWAERVLAPAFRELKSRLPTGDFGPYDENLIVRLESDADFGDRSDGDCLPDKIRVIVNV
ncbi:hypothetical protein LguiA_011027 [Lonicera macranthoides]